MNAKLTDEQFERVKERLNGAIHELVFACQHAEDDEVEDALTCLVTAQGTLDQVAEELVGHLSAAAILQPGGPPAEKGAER